ncbi:hypothetical protein AHAS_Ahas18G0288400 [Arachis hypogaea]
MGCSTPSQRTRACLKSNILRIQFLGKSGIGKVRSESERSSGWWLIMPSLLIQREGEDT